MDWITTILALAPTHGWRYKETSGTFVNEITPGTLDMDSILDVTYNQTAGKPITGDAASRYITFTPAVNGGARTTASHDWATNKPAAYSALCWINWSGTAGNTAYLDMGGFYSNANPLGIWSAGSGALTVIGTDLADHTVAGIFTASTWTLITVTYEYVAGVHYYKVYKNDTVATILSWNATSAQSFSDNPIIFGNRGGGTMSNNSSQTEFFIFKGVKLTQAQIAAAYASRTESGAVVPVVESVAFDDTTPRAGETIVATATVTGTVTTVRYLWKIGATTVRDTGFIADTAPYADAYVVPTGVPANVGQQLSCAITAHNDTGDSNTVTQQYAILNSAPAMTSVAITPDPPGTNSIATANRAGTDADGNTLTFEYQWERWPAPAGPWGDIAAATAQTLNLAVAGNGDAGDQLRVRSRAHDGTEYSGWMTSAAVTVAAAAPNPPTALAMFAADGVTEIASGTHLDYAAAPRSWFAGAWFSDDDAADTVGGQIYAAAEGAAAPDAGTTPTAESALVPQVGGGAAILIEILTLAAGRWKWWARTKSSQGTPSAWVAFSAAAWNVELNTAPALAAIAPQIAHENIDLDIALAASDEDGGAGIALSVPAVPLGWAAAIVDEVVVGAARTATLRLRAGISDARPAAYSVTARASDGFVNADRVFAVTVVNDAPVVAAVADAVAQRGETLEVPLAATDVNGQGVDFRATAEQLEVRQGGVLVATPYWITVEQVAATTGKVVVAPPPGDDAEYEVTVRGKDGV